MGTLDDLMAAIGYLLLQWGFVEKELAEAVEALGGDAPAVTRLHHWRAAHRVAPGADAAHIAAVAAVAARLETARQVRNALCHGLSYAGEDPLGDAPPRAVCRTASGASVTYTLDDIRSATTALEQLRPEIRALTTFTPRLEAHPQNR